MENTLEFDVPDSVTELDSRRSAEMDVTSWARDAMRELPSTNGFVFKLSRLQLASRFSYATARSLVSIFGKCLIELGAPSHLSLEEDAPQEARVLPEFSARTFLPHHDGGHCSYLTPSLCDVPSFDVRLRAFSTSRFNTTHRHKMYQGFFVESVGDRLSITPYYPWRELIRLAYERKIGDGPKSVSDLARWLGHNIVRSAGAEPQHGSRYLSIGGALGAEEIVFHLMPIRAEKDFSEDLYSKFPELRQLAAACPCLICQGPGERLLCWTLHRTVGLNWQQVRARFETRAISDAGDLVFGNNLTTLHAGIDGGRGRRLFPLCLVVENPIGQEYENWLARQWRL